MHHQLPDLLKRLERRDGTLKRLSLRYSRARLALTVAGGTAAFAAGQFLGSTYGWATALAAAVAFALLVRRHGRVERARTRLQRWRIIKARHLARRGIDWMELPPPSDPAPADHPFASDLDVAGLHSILHLIDATATEGGSARLRDWLLAVTPDLEAARQRQERVRALVRYRRFRDRLGLIGMEAAGEPNKRWSAGPIIRWLGGDPAARGLRTWALILSAMAAVTLSFILLDIAGGPTLWTYSLFIYLAIYLSRYVAYADVFDRAYDLQQAVAEAEPMLRFLEDQSPGSREPLRPLWAAFRGPNRPSLHYARLRRITAAAAVTRNELWRIVLNVLLPYDLLTSLALDGVRRKLRVTAPQWFEAYYEIEALASLSAYADLHADTATFPELLSTADTVFEAQSLGHPLLRASSVVRNDVALGIGEVVVLTGSNMSGKSTFLRSIGVATVMAWAGGPVDAAGLRLAPLRPFTSMRVGDELQEGLSTFYAEVRRLRHLLDAVRAPEAPPSLVLIDEMYRGTNNRERLAGARALVRTLSGAHAVSLVATHDLALADLALEIPEVRNAHFREHVEEGRLLFDYRLRPGPCPTTNALVIMEQAGLPIEAPSDPEELRQSRR